MGVSVGLGIADFPFSSAKAFWQWVALCEEGGIDSLWQSDRLVSHQPFLECISTMAAISGATERIKFGMNVCSIALRDPLVTAKQCATIDYLSGGRLLPAFGIGSRDAADWDASGRSFKGVGKKVDEALEIISRLWTEDSVTFEGEHYQYSNAHISPRPVQKRFPLWVGGSSKPAIRRTAQFGTGWQAGRETPAEVAPVIIAIKEAAVERGRPIDHDHFGSGFFFRFGTWDEPCVENRVAAYIKRTPPRDPRQSWAVGNPGDILSRLQEYVDAGIYKFVLRPIGDGDDELMAQTQRLADDVITEAVKLSPRT